MSTDRETTRIVRSWLEEGVTALPNRVLDAVLDQVPATPQRRSWWPPRRFADMNNYAKLAIGAAAAAAVVVVVVVATNLLSRGPLVGPATTGPLPTATTVATSLPTSGPSASPRVLAFPAPGPLAIGRHEMTRSGVRMSLAVSSSGWGSQGDFQMTKNLTDGAFIFWVQAPDGVYEDSCAQVKGPPSTDPATLAADVASIPDTDVVSGPTDVTVGGRPAKEVVLTIAAEPECQTALYLWYDEFGGRWASKNGDRMIVWIVQVDEALVWIDAEMRKDADPALEQEIRAMVDSIQFE